ncbi:MAG TPA: DUF1080 domain-containing protein [Niabella sp.]|mgnify:CR=1 FL=1|nr:DUF1080 domain-containing protein [Niabella sp.]
MKKIAALSVIWMSLAAAAQDKDPRLTEVWQPEPRVVTPGRSAADAPADAIVLFNGKNLEEWQAKDGKPAKWKLEGDAMTVVKGTGEIKTKKLFGDCQLHIEWRTPAEVKGEGQGRGNSGVFLMGRYELQVLDSYNNRTYSNGQAASIYKQLPPLVNASRKPGEWQTYDIIFTAPQFNKDSSIKSQARITVLHNGVLVQNNVSIWGATQYIGIATNDLHSEKAPLALQDHGDAVSFRNIWIREL